MKILVIENQNFQYKEIIEYLGRNEFEYYPQKANYVEFIDHVRVWVNEEYDPNDYRKCSFSYIYDRMQEGCDLILMDHILGGAYHCLTGIDLALALNSKRRDNNENTIPVVFLSKTESNEENRLKQYNEYEAEFLYTSVWVHKGYFGDEILNETYFNQCVIKEIKKLIKRVESSNTTQLPNSLDITKFVEFLKKRKGELRRIEKTDQREEELRLLESLILALEQSKIDINEKVIGILKEIESNIENDISNKDNYSKINLKIKQ